MCELYTGDYEYSSVWSVTKPVARKQHRCNCCGGFIEPRQQYVRIFAASDGRGSSEKSCALCYDAAVEFGDEHHLYPFPSDLVNHLRECYDPRARVYWSDQDRRWRQLMAGILRRNRVAKQRITRHDR